MTASGKPRRKGYNPKICKDPDSAARYFDDGADSRVDSIMADAELMEAILQRLTDLEVQAHVESKELYFRKEWGKYLKKLDFTRAGKLFWLMYKSECLGDWVFTAGDAGETDELVLEAWQQVRRCLDEARVRREVAKRATDGGWIPMADGDECPWPEDDDKKEV